MQNLHKIANSKKSRHSYKSKKLAEAEIFQSKGGYIWGNKDTW